MNVQLLGVLKQRFFDANGIPLAGGQLFSYLAGTTTPAATYQDAAGVTPNANPIVLDGNGYSNVWISVGGGAYKFVLEDSLGNVLWTVDNITVSSADTVSAWTRHTIPDGQVATALTGEAVDNALFSSAKYDVEIIRGTTVFSGGPLEMQCVNGTWRVLVGVLLANEPNNVNFSVSQVGTIGTLLAEVDAGLGTGTIKLSRRLVPV